MPGSITKRTKNSWSVVLDLGRDPLTGRRRQLRRAIKGTKRDAEALLVQLLHQRDLGIDQPPGKLSVGEYLQQWLRDYAKVNTAPATYAMYQTMVLTHALPALGTLPLTKLRPQHLQQLYNGLLDHGRRDGKGGLSPKSVLHLHRILREALNHAVQWQFLANNPADATRPPRPARYEIPALGPEVIQRLLGAAAKTRHRTIIYLAVMTGLRRGELLGLRWADVDLDRGTLSVRRALQRLTGEGITYRAPKTQSSNRSVALSPDTIETLRRHRKDQLEERLSLGPAYQDQGLVFTTPLGTPIDPANLRRAWSGIVTRAGVEPLRFHDLRHAHATLLLLQGIHPKIVSERLGHSSVRITLDTYSHVLPGLQAQAAAQLDLLIGLSPQAV